MTGSLRDRAGKPALRIAKVAMAVLGALGLSGSAWAGGVLNLDKEHVPDQLIVKFKPSISKAAAAAALAEIGASVRHVFAASGALSVELKTKGDTKLLTARGEMLARRPDVDYVEANTIMRIDATTPNDAQFGKLYGLHNAGQTGGTVDADIDAAEAWDLSTGSRAVVVGIIDTGVDYRHPEIAPNYWSNPGETGVDAQGRDKRTNGVDDDANGFVDDFRGWDFANNDNDPVDDHDHGTHCAGTIGGAGNDGVGVAGVNWQVSIVGLKFLTGGGSGTLEDAVEAIEYATKLGVDMTSNSWGGGGFSPTMDAAIGAAHAADILFIAAAGNDGVDNDGSPHYPSSYTHDNVIAVAATDHKDALAAFSCFGLESVDVGAPGVDIYSTKKAGGYTMMSGTSMATPHVAGVAALIKALYPDAGVTQLRSRLINTVDPVPGLAGKVSSGGRVNAFNALENDSVPPGVATDLAVTGAGLSSIDLVWTGAGDDGAMGRAGRYELRWAQTAIETEADWAAATRASASVSIGEDGSVTATMRELPFNTAGFVAVKAVDNVGNVGEMSRSVAFETRAVRKLLENLADTMDGVTAEAPWGVQAVGDNSVYSDSPSGSYANDLDIALALDPIDLDSTDLTLAVDLSWELETNYDFGLVEMSMDGRAWSELFKVTGSGAQRMSFDLSDRLRGASQLHLRFRMTTDYSIVKDGFKVDNITLFAPAI